ANEAGATSTIVSSDKDLMQLVNDRVVMYDTMKDKKIGPAEVMEKFGVGPDKVIEVQALIGDSSDNVPGVPGIGVKTAAQLIGEYGDLETLLKRASEIKQDKRRQSLIDNAEIARISKRLVTLDQNVPLDVPVDQLAVHEPDYKNLIAFLKAMEFNTIARRGARRDSAQAEDRSQQIRMRAHARPPEGMGRARARNRRGGGRYRDHQPRRHAGRTVRVLAGGRAQRSLLRADRSQEGRRRRRLVRCGLSIRPNQGRRCVENPQAVARGQKHPQGRAEPEIRLAGVRAARHRDRQLRRHHVDLL